MYLLSWPLSFSFGDSRMIRVRLLSILLAESSCSQCSSRAKRVLRGTEAEATTENEEELLAEMAAVGDVDAGG